MSLKEGPAAWSTDVAFKRTLRELWRQKNYVPPYQDLPSSTALAATEASPADTQKDSPLWTKGGWTLDVDDAGSVVLRHETGTTVVLATLEGDDNG